MKKLMNQENENIELGQWINVEESRDSKSEMKEVKPMEYFLPAESNQGEEEDVKE